MVEYYGNNDYRDYLAHHGIPRMQWGKRNGPPYPLDYGDHSAAEKRGMAEKGVKYRGTEGSIKIKKKSDLVRIKPKHRGIDAFIERRAEARARKDAEKKERLANKIVESENMVALRDKKNSKYFTTEEIRDLAAKIKDRQERRELISSGSKSKKEKDYDDRKQRMMSDAIKNSDMTEVNKHNNMFTTEELKNMRTQIDERARELHNMAVRSGKEGYSTYEKRVMIEKGDAKKILKNMDSFSIDELNEAVQRYSARQKIKDAQRDARLKAIGDYLQRGAAMSKSVADIAANISNVKKAIDDITGKTKQDDQNILNSLLGSGDRDKIAKVADKLDGKEAAYAAKSIENQDKLKKLLQANAAANSPGDSNGKREQQSAPDQNKKQKQQQENTNASSGETKQQKNESEAPANSDRDEPKVQNGSVSKSNTGDESYDRMMDAWRSAKVTPSKTPSSTTEAPSAEARLRQMSDVMKAGTRVDKDFSKAMNQEIKKYTDMTGGATSRVAKAISKLQTTSYSDGAYSSTSEKMRAAEAMDAWTAQRKAESTPEAKALAKANRAAAAIEIARASKAYRTYVNRKAGAKKAAETRRLNKAKAQELVDERPVSSGPTSSSNYDSSTRTPAASSSSSASGAREAARRALESAALSGSSIDSIENVARAGKALFDSLVNDDNKRGRK